MKPSNCVITMCHYNGLQVKDKTRMTRFMWVTLTHQMMEFTSRMYDGTLLRDEKQTITNLASSRY